MDPKADRSLSGLEALATADCAVFYLRWRTLPEDGPYPQIQPVAWTKTYTGDLGHTARVFFTTLGHPQEFADANLRRLLLNAVFWSLGHEDQIPEAGVKGDLVGAYDPPSTH